MPGLVNASLIALAAPRPGRSTTPPVRSAVLMWWAPPLEPAPVPPPAYGHIASRPRSKERV
ncbi:hypothetical protein [Streptomyces sp. NPDC003522]